MQKKNKTTNQSPLNMISSEAKKKCGQVDWEVGAAEFTDCISSAG